MKTIEEKAKAYDEALERAEQIRNGNPSSGTAIVVCEQIFPELAESEDERIRKHLIAIVELYWGKTNDPDKAKDLAYLEKQEQKPISAVEVLARAGLKPYKDGNQWCILAGDNIQEGICGFGDTIEDALYEFLKEILDLQKEPKPTPDWMPKFLDELRSKKNYFDWDEHRDIEGHILAIINWIDPNYFDRKEKEQKPALTPERIHPKFAVGDTVCRPMWSEHTIREIYVRCDDPVYVCVNEEGTESHISLSEQDKWERKEPKPVEWSEEDEGLLSLTIAAIEDFYDKSNPIRSRIINTLKSLPPSWKPSEEQIGTLERICSNLHLRASDDAPKLDEIIELLKRK